MYRREASQSDIVDVDVGSVEREIIVVGTACE
jgi:hypothetical protein